MEDRTVLAGTVFWDGGPTGAGTSWQTAANWVGDVMPAADDDAMIDAAFAGVSITTNGNVAVNSVTSAANLR